MKLLKNIIAVCTTSIITASCLPVTIFTSSSAESAAKAPSVTTEDLYAEKAYLLGENYASLKTPKDYNGDGTIDVFDMIVLRNMITEAQVSIDEFDVDLFDVHINDTETATFSAAVESIYELGENEISVYDEDGNFVTYLNDDGENGDVYADDGVYSGQADVSSDTRRIMHYYAKTDTSVSNAAEISFWTEFTEEDINNFGEIMADTQGRSFKEVSDYLKKNKNLEKLEINEEDETIYYVTTAGIPCFWGKADENKEGVGKLDISYNVNFDNYDTELQGKDAEKMYKDIVERIDEISKDLKITVVHPDKTKVIVLQPCKEEFFGSETSTFDVVGDVLAKVLSEDMNAEAVKYDNENVTPDLLKELAWDSDIGAVLYNGHGFFNPDLEPDTNYLFTGYSFKAYYNEAGKVNFENKDDYDYFNNIAKDFESERINVFSVSEIIDGYSYITVNGKFFKECYSDYEDNMKDTFWFLGACHSMQLKGENSLAYNLCESGAGAVVGFTDEVEKLYDRRTLCELIVNNMILNQSTVSEGIKDTKNTKTNIKTPFHNNLKDDGDKATITHYGNNDFRLVQLQQEYGTYNYKAYTENVDKTDDEGNLYPEFPIEETILFAYKKVPDSISVKKRFINFKRFYLDFFDHSIGFYPDIYYKDTGERNKERYVFYDTFYSDEYDGKYGYGSVKLPVGDYMTFVNSHYPAKEYYDENSELYYINYDMADIDDEKIKKYPTIIEDQKNYDNFKVLTDVKFEWGGVPGLG